MSESSDSAAPAPVAAPDTLPTQALPQLVPLDADYPMPGDGHPSNFYLGMIMTYATNGNAVTGNGWGAPQAQGQVLQAAAYTSLFPLYRTYYGGDPRAGTFCLPDLRGRIPVGCKPGRPGKQGPQTLAMSYIIAAKPGGGAPVGSVALFGGYFVPGGWLLCDGSSHSPGDYPQLFETIGEIFGGGGGLFAVPDLRDRAVLGTGEGPGLPPVALGQVVPGPVAGLGLTPIICFQGIYADPGNTRIWPDVPFVCQILAFAGQEVPNPWLAVDGSLLPPQSYKWLFDSFGTTYGGDGTTSFALPDLRGRMMTGL